MVDAMTNAHRMKFLAAAPLAALVYLPCALLVNAISRGLFALLGLPCTQQAAVIGWSNLGTARQAATLLLALLISPFMEETLFRWLLPIGLERMRLPRAWAEAIAALAFAAVHVAVPWAWPMLFLFAIAQSKYLKYNGLLFVIIVHAFFNGYQLLLVSLLR